MTITDDRRPTSTRLLAALGAAWGLALLARPRRVRAALCPEFPASRLWLVRVLGARLLVQHAAVMAAPGNTLVRAASAVELLHAASMHPLLRSPRYGRAARISGGVAAASAALMPVIAPRDQASASGTSTGISGPSRAPWSRRSSPDQKLPGS
jgi:hypothetical protein